LAVDLAPGDTLEHYRLLDRIGEGGMGVVWRAVDTTLDREVAIKIVPGELAGDEARMARFEREAKLLATLNHPGIAQVYGLHGRGAERLLAMELVPGEDLAQRLRRGPLDLDECLEVGLQVAAALEAAHLGGVIHRDLKPANVVSTPAGRLKVLDFGLACLAEHADDAGLEPSLSPTLSTPATADGVLLGTAAYMSPEQARGRPVDKRTDLWAFGCLLFECLSGQQAFQGDTLSDTLAAILRSEPDWSALPETTPARVRELLHRCLAKDPDRRQRDAGDARLDLEAARAEPAAITSGSASGGRARPPWLVPAVSVAGLLVAALLLLGGLRPPAGTQHRVVRAALDLPAGWHARNLRISPDGRFVAVVAEGAEGRPGARARRAFLRDLGADDRFRAVPGTVALDPIRFSPDSSQVALVQRGVAGVSGDTLVRAPADGSTPPALVARWHEAWLDDLLWLSDQEIAVVSRDPIQLVRLSLDGSGSPAPVDIRLDGATERFLLHAVIPGGILGTVESWVGGYHQDAALLDPVSGEVTVLLDRAFDPTWVEPGWLFFSRQDQLLGARFDADTTELQSVPQVVAVGLRATMEATAAIFSLSERGDLVHLEGGLVGNDRRLVWLGEAGVRTPWSAETGPYIYGSIDDSQDGRVVAFMRLGTTGLYEVWASEVDDPAPRRALSQPGMDCSEPTVSDDGRLIAALCFGDSSRDGIYVTSFPSINARGSLVLVAQTHVQPVPCSWGSDGTLLLTRPAPDGQRLQRLMLDDVGRALSEPEPVTGVDGNVGHAMISPDGRQIGFSEWDGSLYVLHVAPWDGTRAGPPRPVMRTQFAGFDWTGIRRDGGWEIAAINEHLEPTYAVIDGDGRVLALETVRRLTDLGTALLGAAYLADGRILAIEADPAEVAAGGVRLVTDWTSTLAE
jgi:hypothetical protein